MTHRSFPAVFVLLALLAAGCGDDDAAPAADATTTTTESTATTTAAPAPAPDTDQGAVPTTTDTATEAGPYDGYVSEIYDDPAVWICWPGADDTCAENQDLTLVAADGTLEVVPFTPVDDAPVDCFYVYPTVSGDQTANSVFVDPATQEIYTTRSQAARYGSAGRVFAPVYRQNALASLTGRAFAPDGGWSSGVFGIPTVGFAPGEARYAHTNRERLDVAEARWALARHAHLIPAVQTALND